MSLISLTFGENSLSISKNFAHTEILGPQANHFDGNTESCVIEVTKVEKFLGTDEVCILGILKGGLLQLDMFLEESNERIKIVEINSKYGSLVAKPGTQVLVVVSNAMLAELKGKPLLTFKKKAEVKEKKKGQFIVC